MNILNRTNILILLISFCGLLFIFSIYHRAPHIDDAWIGEHAYWVSETGAAKSELMRGVTMQEQSLVVHHKFLVYQGAALIKMFGFSLYTLKSLSLIYFLLFLFAFFHYLNKKVLSYRETLLAILFVISNALFFEYAFVYRPEIPLMTLGLFSYILLDKAINKKEPAYLIVMGSGLLAGLGFSTHLNGVIFLVSGFFLLIWNRKYKYSMVFALASIPTVFIYFIDMLSMDKLQLWYVQMFSSPSIDSFIFSGSVSNFILRILKTLNLFFHSPKEISFTVLIITTYLLAYKHLKQHKNHIRYAFLLFVSLALLAVHTSSKYLLLYMPYLILLCILSIRYIFDPTRSLIFCHSLQNKKLAGKLISAVIVLYLMIQVYYDVRISFDKFDRKENDALIKQYVTGKTEDLNMIAPMIFIFNQIESFNRIQSDLCYVELRKADSSIYKEGFLRLAFSYENDYIFLPKRNMIHFGIDKMTDEEVLKNNYMVLLRKENMVILKKSNP
jgi:hypothetical protein